MAHALNGGLFLLAIILTLIFYTTGDRFDRFRIIILVLLFGIIVGIHGLSHLGLEYIYGYSPYNMIFGRNKHECNCPHCPMMRQHLMKEHSKKKAEEGFQCPMMGRGPCPMMSGQSCALKGDS